MRLSASGATSRCVSVYNNRAWRVGTGMLCEILTGCGYFLFWLPRVVIPVSVVWGTLSLIHYALGLEFSARWLLIVGGGVSGALALVTHILVWLRGPGSPLEFSELRVRDLEEEISVPLPLENAVEAKHDGGARFCSKCRVFKPDRTHHCRQCGTCVLRMDHHCPWFSACIGLRNHKYFLQFLAYTWLLCVCSIGVSGPIVMQYFQEELYKERFIGVNFVFFMVLGVNFYLVLTAFGLYTWYLAAMNRTTLESLEPLSYRTSLPASQWRYRHPPTRQTLGNIYDIGILANLEQIMGTQWLEWLLPVRSQLKTNGCSFPINHDLQALAEKWAQTEIAMHERKRHNQQQTELLENSHLSEDPNSHEMDYYRT